MQVVNGRNTAVTGTKALVGQTLAEACLETPENPVSFCLCVELTNPPWPVISAKVWQCWHR